VNEQQMDVFPVLLVQKFWESVKKYINHGAATAIVNYFLSCDEDVTNHELKNSIIKFFGGVWPVKRFDKLCLVSNRQFSE
jgi:hypothetical protein